MKYLSILNENNITQNCIQIPDSISDPLEFYKNNFVGILALGHSNIGDTYDESRDAFIPPKPYSSWTLNEETCHWDSPVPYPTDGELYIWNEETTSWDLIPSE